MLTAMIRATDIQIHIENVQQENDFYCEHCSWPVYIRSGKTPHFIHYPTHTCAVSFQCKLERITKEIQKFLAGTTDYTLLLESPEWNDAEYVHSVQNLLRSKNCLTILHRSHYSLGNVYSLSLCIIYAIKYGTYIWEDGLLYKIDFIPQGRYHKVIKKEPFIVERLLETKSQLQGQ